MQVSLLLYILKKIILFIYEYFILYYEKHLGILNFTTILECIKIKIDGRVSTVSVSFERPSEQEICQHKCILSGKKKSQKMTIFATTYSYSITYPW